MRLAPLVFVALLGAAAAATSASAQVCTSQAQPISVVVPAGFVNQGFQTAVAGQAMPASSTCTFAFSFASTLPSSASPEPYPLLVNFDFNGGATNFGASYAIYDTSTQATLTSANLLGTFSGSTFTVNTNGPKARYTGPPANAQYTTTWNGADLRLRAISFAVVVTSGATPLPGFQTLVQIASHVSGYDLDNDGYTWPSYDCCETQRNDTALTGYPGCFYPSQVNIGAFEIGGNGVVDAGAGASCTARSGASNSLTNDVSESQTCSFASDACNAYSSSGLTGANCPIYTGTRLLQAMDICQFNRPYTVPPAQSATSLTNQWSVTSSSLTLADGTSASRGTVSYVVYSGYYGCYWSTATVNCAGRSSNANYYGFADQSAVLTPAMLGQTAFFAGNVIVGDTMAVLSTGFAASHSGAYSLGGCLTSRSSALPWYNAKCNSYYPITANVPSSYLSKHNNVLETSGGCNTGSASVYDSIMLTAVITAPTNALSFSYNLRFLSQEFPYWVCTIYNDFFLALMSSDDPRYGTPGVGNSPIPADGNIARAPSGASTVPLTINYDAFFTVCQGNQRNSNYNIVGAACVTSTYSQLVSTGFNFVDTERPSWTSTSVNFNAGASSQMLTNTVNVIPNSQFTVRFLIFDVSDFQFQSTVVLDGFQWNALPVPAGGSLGFLDQCPTDPLKTAPGICGCNVADTDSDGDGVANCKDACPFDSTKTTSVGLCGCGVSDVNYLGADPACATTMQCCATGGYLGGRLAWQQSVSNARADEMQILAQQTLASGAFCAGSNTPTAFARCSTVSLAGQTAVYPSVGSVLPSHFLNYGLLCPSAVTATPATPCPANSHDAIVALAATGAWVAASSATAYQGSYIYISGPTAGASYIVSLPAGMSGTLYISTYATKPTVAQTFARMTATVTFNGGASSATVNFVPTGLGWRVLGAWQFLGTPAVERVVFTTVDTGASFLLMLNALRFTSYDPACDLMDATAALGAAQTLTYYTYLPGGTGARFEAAPLSGTCTLDLYVNANVDVSTTAFVYRDLASARPATVANAAVNVVAAAGGQTFAVLAVVATGSCTPEIRRSVLVPATVVSVNVADSYVVAQASTTVHFPARACVANPAPYTVAFEGLSRDTGTGLRGRSYRVSASVAAPYTAVNANGRSPALALPPLLRVPSGVALSFRGWGGSAVGGSLSQASASALSAKFYPQLPVATAGAPASSSFSGSYSFGYTYNLPALGADYYLASAVVTDSGAVSTHDLVLRVLTPVGGNVNPTVTIGSPVNPLFLNCPNSFTVTGTGGGSNAVYLEYVPLPSTWATGVSTATASTATTATATISFTPVEATALALLYGAYDLKNGTAYASTVLTPTARSCPLNNGVQCNNRGTCTCAGTCQCNARWSGNACQTYANTAPTVSPSAFTINQNSGQGTYQLVASDAEGDAVTFSNLVGSQFHGTIALSAAGLLTFTPTTNYFSPTGAPDTIQVTLTDNGVVPASATYTITITIQKVYVRPTVPNFAATVQENCAATSWNLLSTITNPNGYALTFSLPGTTGSKGTASFAGSMLTYACANLQYGVDTIPFQVNDGQGQGPTGANIVMTVTFVHQAPTVASFTVNTDEDTPVSRTLQSNNIDGAPAVHQILSQPAQGTVVLTNAATGAFTYTPQQYKPGTYTFTYNLLETGDVPGQPGTARLTSNTGTVTLVVAHVNHAPTAQAVAIQGLENAPSIAGTYVGSDNDVGDTLSYAYVAGSLAPAGAGSVVAGSGAAFSFVPAANWFGTATFTYRVTDNGGLSGTATVTVTVLFVNVAPIVTLNAVTVNQNAGTGTYSPLWSSINFGPNAAVLSLLSASVAVMSDPAGVFASAPSLSNAGVLSYSVKPNVFGVATLAVTVRNNGGTANGGVDSSTTQTTFTVRFVNQAPSFMSVAVASVPEDTPGQVARTFATNISPGPAGESVQTVAFNVVTGVCTPIAAGTLFAAAPVFGADGIVRFTLNPLYYSTCTYTINLQDNGGTANGGVDTSANAVVTITVTPVPHAPAFNALATTWTVLESATAGNAISLNFANGIFTGSSQETDTMAFVVSSSGYTGAAYFATGPFTATPTVAPATPGSTGVLQATQRQYANGNVTLSVILTKPNLSPVLSSPAATLNVRIVPVNNAPSFTLATPTLSYYNSDVTSTTTVTVATGAVAGPADEVATQTLAFVVTHDCEGSAPLFAQQPTVTVQGTAGAQTGVLSFSIQAYRSTYLLSGGSCTLSVVLRDSGDTTDGGSNASPAQTITLTITPVNQAPSFTAPSTLTYTQSGSGNIVVSTPWASAISAGPYETWQISSLAFTITTVSGASLFAELPTVSPAGVIAFQIKPLVSGSATFSVVLQDGYGTAHSGQDTSAPFSLVISVPSATFPVSFQMVSAVTVPMNSATYTNAAFLTGIDASSLLLAQSLTASVQVTSGASLLTGTPQVTISQASFDGNGAGGVAAVSFTPAPGVTSFGTVTFSVTLSSSSSTSAPRSATVTITYVNQAPTFAIPQPAQVVQEDVGAVSVPAFATSIIAAAGNPYGTTVTFAVTCTNAATLFSAGGAPAISPQGTLTFTSAVSEVGTSACSAVATNNGSPALSSASVPFTIEFTYWNHVPSFTAGADQTVLQNAGTVTVAGWATGILPGPPNEYAQTVGFALTGFDAALFEVAPTLNVVGTSYPKTATLSFRGKTNVYGSTTVTVVLSDSEGASTAARSLGITITFVNQAPSFALSASAISVPEYSGAQTVPGFVLNAVAGPDNALENAQTLTWIVTASNAALFAKDSNNQPLLAIVGGALEYTLASGVFGTTTLTVTATDNGGTANGGQNSFALSSISLTVTFVNRPPTFTCGAATVTVLQNSGANAVAGWASAISPGDPSETATQTVTFNVTVDAASPMPVSGLAVAGGSGTLSFATVTQMWGSVAVTVQACDSLGLCSVQTCPATLQVLFVNQAPTFTRALATVSVLENSGASTIAGVFTGMSAGPGYNEAATQTLAFDITVVSASPSNLLVGTPTANAASGALSLQPRANLFGNATLRVTLRDDGGTTNGGVDTSATATVLVQVLWVNQAPSATLLQSVVSMPENSGAQSVSGLWSAISAGPDNEAWQTVAFTVIDTSIANLNAPRAPFTLFAVAPAISSAGVVTFLTNADAYGTATLTVRLRDSGGTANGGVDTAPATFTLTIDVTRVNQVPLAVNDLATTPENQVATFGVLANDYSDWDFDLGTLTLRVAYIVSASVSSGTVVTVAGNGLGVVYTPRANWYGVDTFQYVATDGACTASASLCFSAPATVTVNVTHVFIAPVTQPVAFTVVGDGVYTSAATALFVASTPNAGDPIAFALQSQPAHGTASLVGGVFTYTPTLYYCGPDSLTYSASSGPAVGNTSPVTITVTCINHAPTASNITATMDENTVSSSGKTVTLVLSVADVDAADQGQLTYSCAAPGFAKGQFSPAAGATSATSVAIVYSPTPYKNGVDAMRCTVSDPAGATATFWAIVTVIGPAFHNPHLVTPLVLSGYSDVPGAGQLQAIDYDGLNTLAYSILTPPPASLCTVSLNTTTGAFTYVSARLQFGQCSFTWTVVTAQSLGPDNAPGLVQINIQAVQHNPVTYASTHTAYQNFVLSNQQLNVTDLDSNQAGAGLTVAVVTNTPASAGTVVITNAATGVFQFTPATNYFGTTSFTYRATSNFGMQSSVTTATIVVVRLNQPPTAQSGTATTPMNTPVNVLLPYTDIDTPLANMTFAILQAPTSGTAAISTSVAQTAVYTPASNWYGVDSFRFSVSDGQYTATGTITVNVTFVHYPPTAQDATWTVPANTVYQDQLSIASFQFPQTLTAVLFGAGPQNGSVVFNGGTPFLVTYTPRTSTDPNYASTDSFQFRAFDGTLYSAVSTVRISITRSPFRAPTAASFAVSAQQEQPYAFVLQGADPNTPALPLTYSIVAAPTLGTLSGLGAGTGQVTYTGASNKWGTDTFTYKVSNGYYSSTVAAVTVNVLYVNKPPLAASLSFTTNENTALSAQLSATNINGPGPLRYILTVPTTSGTVAVNDVTGQFTYTPSTYFYGTDSFQYKAFDGVGYSTTAAKVTITVVNVHQPPIPTSASIVTREDVPYTGTLACWGPDSTTYRFYITASRVLGSVTVDRLTGRYTYMPPPAWSGADEFAFTCDDTVLSSTGPGTVSVTVTHVDRAPEALAQTVNGQQNQAVSVTLTSYNRDNLPVTYTLLSLTTVRGGTLQQTSVGSPALVYTPPSQFFGTDSFSFTCNSGSLASPAPALVTLQIAHVNQPPTVSPLVLSIAVSTSTIVAVPSSDPDLVCCDDTLMLAALPTAAMGNVAFVPDPPAAFLYTARTTPGTETLTVTVRDREGLTATTTVTIYITGASVVPPVISDLKWFGTEDQQLRDTLAWGIVRATSNVVSYTVSGLDGSIAALDASTNAATGFVALNLRQYYFGTFSFKYQVRDANNAVSNVATVTVTIDEYPYAPTAYPRTVTINQDTTASFTLQASDVNGHNSFVFSVASTGNAQQATISLDSASGACTFKPPAGRHDTYVFYYRVFNGFTFSAPAAVTVVVNKVYAAPVAQSATYEAPQNAAVSGVLPCSQVDGLTLSFAWVGGQPQALLALGELESNQIEGTFTLTPTGAIFGTFTAQFYCSAQTPAGSTLTSNTGTITVVLTYVNKPPTAFDLPLSWPQATYLNAATYSARVTALDPQDGANLRAFVQNSDPSYGALSFASDGTFDYAPAINYVGQDSFTFYALDVEGLQSNVATVTITLLAVRVPPLARVVTVNVDEDSSVEGQLEGVSAYPDSVTYTIKVAPVYGTLDLLDASAGTFRYTPRALYHGSDFAAYTVTDSDGSTVLESSIASVAIQVAHINHAPVARNFSITATAGVNYVGEWDGSDVDAGDVLTGVPVASATTAGTASTESGLAFTYLHPATAAATTDVVAFYVQDQTGTTSDVAYMTVTVLAAPPVAPTMGESNNNTTGTNIAGAAVGAVLAALVLVALAALAWYRYREAYAVSSFQKEAMVAAANMSNSNPLYVGMTNEFVSPLYQDPSSNRDHIWERQPSAGTVRQAPTGTVEDLYRDAPTHGGAARGSQGFVGARSLQQETFLNPLFASDD